MEEKKILHRGENISTAGKSKNVEERDTLQKVEKNTRTEREKEKEIVEERRMLLEVKKIQVEEKKCIREENVAGGGEKYTYWKIKKKKKKM